MVRISNPPRAADLASIAQLTRDALPPPWSIDELEACLVVKDSGYIGADRWPQAFKATIFKRPSSGGARPPGRDLDQKLRATAWRH
jgi:hypothetical protein